MYKNLTELTEAIENKIDIQNVLDFLGFIKGKQQNSYFCKIHNEKHPSFLAYKGQQTWKCSSKCGSGNIYQLYQKFFAVDDLTAIKEVAVKIANINESEIMIGKSKYDLFLEKITDVTDNCRNWLNKIRLIDDIEIKQLEIKSFIFSKDDIKEEYVCFPYKINNEIKGYKVRSISNKKNTWIRAKHDLKQEGCLYPDDNINENTEILCLVAGEPDLAIFKKLLREAKMDNYISVKSNLTGENNIPKNLSSFLKNSNIKEIRIFYDHDETGKIGAENIAKYILEETDIKDIFIYNFPKEINNTEIKKGFDISDYYKEGFGISDIFNLGRYKYTTSIDKKENSLYETERTILNAVFFENKLIYDLFNQKLKPFHFKDYRFKEIIALAYDFFNKHNYLDIDVFEKELKDLELKKACSEIIGAKSILSVGHLLELIELLKFEFTKNEALRLIPQIEMIVKNSENRKQVLNDINKISDELTINNIENKNHFTVSDLIDNYEEDYTIPESELFIPSPWEEVNKLLAPGIEVSMVSLLGAKTSTGKTTLARQWADFTASIGIDTIMYVTETKKSNLANMTLSHRTKIENYSFRRKNLGEDYKNIIKSGRRHYDNKLIYVDAHDMAGTEVIEDIRLQKRKNPKLKFVVVDHFHAFEVEKGFPSELIYHNNLIAKFVKCAMSENVGILLPCHLKRSDNRFGANLRPTVEDFSGTSNLEKRANTIFALFYEGEQLVLGLLKNRGSERGRFINLEHEAKFSYFKTGQ